MAIGEQEREAGPVVELPLLDGKLDCSGPIMLTLPLPAAAGTLDVPATLDGTIRVQMDSTGSVRVDAQGTLEAPLDLKLALAGGLGRLDVDGRLSGDARLDLGLPGNYGQLQAHLRAVGTTALRLDLPGGGRFSAHSAVDMPLTLAMLLPDSRARLGIHHTIPVATKLELRLPRGGSVEAAAPVELRLDGLLFLPSGSGELQATAPIRTRAHIKYLAIPQLHAPLDLDLRVDGTAELTTELPARGTRIRAHFTAALPLAPLRGLIWSELERHVQVEQVELRPPRLRGPHDLLLPVSIVARRGVPAELLVTAHLRIDPRSNYLELRSINAEGLNVAGHAVAWLYVNPWLLRSLRHTRLFDPSASLPPQARVEALGFKPAGRGELSVEGILTWHNSPTN